MLHLPQETQVEERKMLRLPRKSRAQRRPSAPAAPGKSNSCVCHSEAALGTPQPRAARQHSQRAKMLRPRARQHFPGVKV